MGKPKERVHLIDLEVDGVDNIKFNLKGTRWEGVHWSDLAQERQGVGSSEYGNGHRFQYKVGGFLTV